MVLNEVISLKALKAKALEPPPLFQTDARSARPKVLTRARCESISCLLVCGNVSELLPPRH